LENEENIEIWAEKNLPFVKIIFSKEFILFYALFMCYIFYGHYMLNIFKIFGLESIKNDAVLTFIGSFGALLNGLCRIFWATLLDFYTFKQVFSALLTL